MGDIYLDCASTTQVHPAVKNAMLPFFDYYWGNSSSHHHMGEIPKNAIEDAREIIASSIGAEPSEIYFTSSGSESNNWVIKGLKNHFKFNPMHIISDTIEHHSILRAIEDRYNACKDITYSLVGPESTGIIGVQNITGCFKLHTKLVSVMAVNNELGTVQPINEIAEKCRDNGILFHTDYTQGYCHIPINVKKQHIDLLTASGHKIMAPKGIGFLYISNDCISQYMPLISGGQQEMGMRAGTENVPYIVGLGHAVELAMDKIIRNQKLCDESHNILVDKLASIPGIQFNGDIEQTDKRHINIRIEGCRAEELMALLSEQEIYVSAGSACNSDSGKPSHVLKAIGLSDDEANNSIRISYNHTLTDTDINYFIDMLGMDIKILRERL